MDVLQHMAAYAEAELAAKRPIACSWEEECSWGVTAAL